MPTLFCNSIIYRIFYSFLHFYIDVCFVAPKEWDLKLIYKNELKILILIFVFYCPEDDFLLVETRSHVTLLTKNLKIVVLMMIDNYLVKNCIVYYSTATGNLATNISFEILSISFFLNSLNVHFELMVTLLSKP